VPSPGRRRSSATTRDTCPNHGPASAAKDKRQSATKNIVRNPGEKERCAPAHGLAEDSSHLYWTSVGGTGTINEVGLDGSNNHAILSGQGTPTGVAVDSGHIYWANGISSTGTINKANLDGTGVTTLATGQNEPRGVAVGPR
jgi:hypothetical protein